MFVDIPRLNHQEQQKAVAHIHKLMANGMSSREAIALVAKEIRAKYVFKKHTNNNLKEEK